jgi:hypothetical protein
MLIYIYIYNPVIYGGWFTYFLKYRRGLTSLISGQWLANAVGRKLAIALLLNQLLRVCVSYRPTKNVCVS